MCSLLLEIGYPFFVIRVWKESLLVVTNKIGTEKKKKNPPLNSNNIVFKPHGLKKKNSYMNLLSARTEGDKLAKPHAILSMSSASGTMFQGIFWDTIFNSLIL